MKVLCTLPNASENINGVKFSSTDDGMLSEDVSEEVAKRFSAIEGYSIVDTKSAKAQTKGKTGDGAQGGDGANA